MPRPAKSDVASLLQEVHAIEMVASDSDVPLERIEEYWSLSTDLIALVAEIEEFGATHPDASYDDPTMFTFKHRLRAITSTLAELSLE